MLKNFAMYLKAPVLCWMLSLIISASFALPPAARADGTVSEKEASSSDPTLAYEIVVRRHDPANKTRYSHEATVAVGGIKSSEHEADLLITVTKQVAGRTVPAVGLRVPVPSMVTDAVVGPPAQPSVDESVGVNNVHAVVTLDNQSVTDSHGRVTGHFRSSNKASAITLSIRVGTPPAPNALPPVVASALVRQDWNELAGEHEAWASDDFFKRGLPATIIYKMSFDNGIPITGHSIWLQTDGMTGEKWNPRKPVDVDGDGKPDFYGDYECDILLNGEDPELQPGGIYDNLVAYGATVERKDAKGKPTGHYAIPQTVKDYVGPDGYVDFCVDTIDVDVEDDNAYADMPDDDPLR